MGETSLDNNDGETPTENGSANESELPPLNQNFDENDDDEVFTTRKTSTKRTRIILDDSDDELNENTTSLTPVASPEKNLNLTQREETTHEQHFHKLFQESDLYDAENSDDDNTGKNYTHKNEGSNRFDELTLKKEKKNSKRKNIRTKETIRKEKEDVFQLHRESQRLIRESRVSLPYHVPKQKPLEYFLNRKKTAPTELKPLPPPFIPKKSNMSQESLHPTKEEKNELNSENSQPLNSEVNKTEDNDGDDDDDDDDELPDVFAPDPVKTEDKQNENEDTVKSNNPTPPVEKQIPPEQNEESNPPKTRSTLAPSLTALKNLQFDSITPHLSEPKKFPLICLSDGMSDFVQRFVDHTTNLKQRVKRKEETESSIINETPGAKLLSLKKVLHAKIVAKREEARQKRLALYKLDNEEGFEEKEEEKLDDDEEEEAELTEQSDTDEESEEEDDIIMRKEKKIKRNVFIDDEAEDEDEEFEERDEEIEEEGDELDEDEEQTENDQNESEDKSIKTPVKEYSNRKTSDDMFSLNAEDEKLKETNGDDKMMDELPSIKNSDSSTDLKMITTPKANNIPRKITDKTPDNFPSRPKESPDNETQMTKYTPKQNREKVNCYLSQFQNSQFSPLMTQPVPKIRPVTTLFTSKKSKESSQDMDDLLSLCSGKFDNFITQEEKNSQFVDNDLLKLCSGDFKTQLSDVELEDDDSFKSLPSMNVQTENRKRKREEEEEIDEITGDELDEEIEDNVQFQTRKKKFLSEFLEDEAELSGSEASSDEEENAEDDILEVEEGDEDELVPNDELLREQVGRAHFKALLDEDKRDLRLFKEMYLEDGDLHTDGKGRERKFRWRDIYGNSEDTQMNISDTENGNEEEEKEDAKWRIERYEREKWLSEKKKDEEESCIEILNVKKKKDCQEVLGNVEKLPVPVNFLSPTSPSKVKFRRGSFFSKAQENPQKSDKKRTEMNVNGVKNSRNFVFAAVSPPAAKKQPVNEVKKMPVCKKPKLERKNLVSEFNSTTNSIFQFF